MPDMSGWAMTERELNDRRAAMAAELQRVTAELATCRERNAAIAVQSDQYRDERDDARKAFAKLAGHFAQGAQSGWTARVSGTVLRRLCAMAMCEPPSGATDKVAEVERRFLGDLDGWKPTGLHQPEARRGD